MTQYRSMLLALCAALTLLATPGLANAQNLVRPADPGSFGPWGHVHSAFGRANLVASGDSTQSTTLIRDFEPSSWQFFVVDYGPQRTLPKLLISDCKALNPAFILNLREDGNLRELFKSRRLPWNIFQLPSSQKKPDTVSGFSFSHENSAFILLSIAPTRRRLNRPEVDFLINQAKAHNSKDNIFIFLTRPLWVAEPGFKSHWEDVHKQLSAFGNIRCIMSRASGTPSKIHRGGLEYLTFGAQGALIIDKSGPKIIKGDTCHIETITNQRLTHTVCPQGSIIRQSDLAQEQQFLVNSLRHAIVPETIKPLLIRTNVIDEVKGIYQYKLTNPSRYKLEVTAVVRGAESEWVCTPSHDHFRIGAGKTVTRQFRFTNAAKNWDKPYLIPWIYLQTDVVFEHSRLKLQERRFPLKARIAAVDQVPLRRNSCVAFKSRGLDLSAVFTNVQSTAQLTKFGIEFEINCTGEQLISGAKARLLSGQIGSYSIYLTRRRKTLKLTVGDGKTTTTKKLKLAKAGWHKCALFFGAAKNPSQPEQWNLSLSLNDCEPQITTLRGVLTESGSDLGAIQCLFLGADKDGSADSETRFDNLALLTTTKDDSGAIKETRRSYSFNFNPGPLILDSSKANAHLTHNHDVDLFPH